MARASDYYNSIGRSDGIAYNLNAVNILYRSEELEAIQYDQAVFGTKENYLLWLKAQAENNILELAKTLQQLNEQAGRSDGNIGALIVAGSAALSSSGIGVFATAITAGAGALVSFLEGKVKSDERERIKAQANQVLTELAKQKTIYDQAVSELASIRNQRILFGLLIALGLYLFTKNHS